MAERLRTGNSSSVRTTASIGATPARAHSLRGSKLSSACQGPGTSAGRGDLEQSKRCPCDAMPRRAKAAVADRCTAGMAERRGGITNME